MNHFAQEPDLPQKEINAAIKVALENRAEAERTGDEGITLELLMQRMSQRIEEARVRSEKDMDTFLRKAA